MSLRRYAAAAVAALSLSLAAPAAAQAQDLSFLGDLNNVATQLISGADCGTVRTTLTVIKTPKAYSLTRTPPATSSLTTCRTLAATRTHRSPR